MSQRHEASTCPSCGIHFNLNIARVWFCFQELTSILSFSPHQRLLFSETGGHFRSSPWGISSLQPVGQGFQYLYLTEADYKSLPSGAVIGKLVPGVGYALDAVVGQGLSSLVQGDVGWMTPKWGSVVMQPEGP